MGFEQRRTAIERVEELRQSRVLTYVLSDRESHPRVPGFSLQLSGEPQLLLFDQLEAIGKVPRLDLFLYTRGGNTDSVWPLVSLLREYCDELNVLVAFRAHSAGTLVCLGADTVVMTRLAELSPVDPTTGNQFNPVDQQNSGNRLGISVEDVSAYFNLAKTTAKNFDRELDQDHVVQVFDKLASEVHPLALGNVQRVYLQIRRLAKSLLELHRDSELDGRQIDAVVEGLTEKFYSHVHFISRTEALQFQLEGWVVAPPRDEEEAILALFETYASDLALRERFNLADKIGDASHIRFPVIGGYIESRGLSHRHQMDLKVSQLPDFGPNVQLQLQPGAEPQIPDWAGRQYRTSVESMGWRVNEVSE